MKADTTPGGSANVLRAPVQRATLIAIGSIMLATGLLRRVIDELDGTGPEAGVASAKPAATGPEGRGEFAVAALFEVENIAVGGARLLERGLGRIGGVAAALPVVGTGVDAVRGVLDRQAARGREIGRDGRDQAAGFLRALTADIVAAVIEQVDLDRVIERVDLDRVVSRLDLDEIVAGVDLDRIVARIDIDAIIERVDVNAVVDRVDLPAAAQRALDDEIVDEIIRASTSSVGSDAVDELRTQGMAADRLLGSAVDRLLRRRSGRRVALNGAGASAEAQRPEDESPSD